MSWRYRIEPITRPLFRVGAKLLRGMTLGVRGLVIDADRRVLLVHHTYVRGWYMPGGGVERGETSEQALLRELVEEAGIEATAAPRLLAIHTDSTVFRGDHVLVYRVDRWREVPASSRGEISAVEWFPVDRLPHDVTRLTRAWIEHALDAEDAPP